VQGELLVGGGQDAPVEVLHGQQVVELLGRMRDQPGQDPVALPLGQLGVVAGVLLHHHQGGPGAGVVLLRPQPQMGEQPVGGGVERRPVVDHVHVPVVVDVLGADPAPGHLQPAVQGGHGSGQQGGGPGGGGRRRRPGSRRRGRRRRPRRGRRPAGRRQGRRRGGGGPGGGAAGAAGGGGGGGGGGAA